ncbi:MAG: PH domain-containing protein [Thermoplasmatota archaeon]
MAKKPGGLDLTGDEKVIWSGRRSWKNFLGPLFLSFLIIAGGIVLFSGYFIEVSWEISLGVVGFGFIILLGIEIKRLASMYAITDQQVYSRYGFLSRNINNAMLENLTDNTINQSLAERILNYGTVKFNTAGSSDMEIVFKGVSHPHDRIKEAYTHKEEEEDQAI